MSVWFSSSIVYGVKVPFKTFEEVAGEEYWEDDMLRMDNNEEGIGWATDDGDWAIYGKIVHEGTDNGNDNPLGGDGEMTELHLLNEEQKAEIKSKTIGVLGIAYARNLRYYVVGNYS